MLISFQYILLLFPAILTTPKLLLIHSYFYLAQPQNSSTFILCFALCINLTFYQHWLDVLHFIVLNFFLNFNCFDFHCFFKFHHILFVLKLFKRYIWNSNFINTVLINCLLLVSCVDQFQRLLKIIYWTLFDFIHQKI